MKDYYPSIYYLFIFIPCSVPGLLYRCVILCLIVHRTLGMELAIRTTGGQLVDPLHTSTYRLNSMHDEANARIDKNMVRGVFLFVFFFKYLILEMLAI